MAKKRNLTVVTPTVSVPAPALKPKNHFAFVIDASSSMGGLAPNVRSVLAALVKSIKEGASLYNQEATISVYYFADHVTRELFMRDAQEVSTIAYNPYGNTALYDGMGKAIEDFMASPAGSDSNSSFVIVGITDGQENASRYFGVNNSVHHYGYNGKKDLLQLISKAQGTDRFTITFQLPPGYGRQFARNNSIPEGNVREWEQTAAGVREVGDTVERGTSAYFNSRSLGLKSVDSFYVKTDLSKLKKSDLNKLVDQSSRFKAWTVDKEADVKEFVESHGKKFVIGSVFYALTKKEKVQPQKAVLLQEKGNKAVYAGQEARDLIGLPQGAHATVEPGNHANYDIYVQSTSVNRKLVRGTKVLFDTSLAVDLQSTWDHVGAKLAADAKKARQTP